MMLSFMLLVSMGVGPQSDGHGCEKLMDKICPDWKQSSVDCTKCVSCCLWLVAI